MNNQNHPAPGSKITVSPIRYKKDIKAIKKILKDEPRNLAMFTLGINTALRASDLLKLTYGQLSSVKEGDFFNIKYSGETLKMLRLTDLKSESNSHLFI